MAEGTALVTGAPGWAGTRLVKYMRCQHPGSPAGRERVHYGRVRCLVFPTATGVERLGFQSGPGLREGRRRSVQWCLENGHVM